MILNVSEIAKAAGVPCPAGADVRVAGVTWDSRAVVPGCLYVALPGQRVDGHDFVDVAVQAGAAAVLVERSMGTSVPEIVVADTSAALADVAAFWRDCLEGTVVGLTGSSGKTTTKNLVRDVLAAVGDVVATKANQNNELGVPNTLLAAEADTDHVVVEMGMRGEGQIADLCRIAQPDWGLVTNVGESHIELLGSRQAIARAKSELLAALPDARGVAFVNAADDFAGEVVALAELQERGVRIVFFTGGDVEAGGVAPGVAALAQESPCVWASDIRFDGQGRPTFTMHAARFDALDMPQADGTCSCTLALRGAHNVSNACSAAAVGLAAGLSLDECCRVLAASQPEQGRQQVKRGSSGVTVVDDSYNANPDSMLASLSMFSSMRVPGRRIAVLGDMLELGSHSRASHERVGRAVAESPVDLLVCVGALSQDMARAAREAGLSALRVVEVADAQAALAEVREAAREGDVVLVKASHSVGLEVVAEGLVS